MESGRRWTAIAPLAMSVAGLALILGHVATAGGVRETDEGAAARIWQLLMAGQVPLIGLHALASLPRPARALAVLALHAAGLAANLAMLRFFEL